MASVALAPVSAILLPQETRQLTATPLDANGNPLADRPMGWSSSRDDVALVSQTGLVTAVAHGDAVITATSEGRSAVATVTVSDPPPPSSELGVTESEADVDVQLPAGAGLELDDLELWTALQHRSEVSAAGPTSVTAFEGGPQIALVTTPEDELVLMGWIDPAEGVSEISARTTAEVLAYFDLGGHLLVPELREPMLEALQTSPALDPLEAAIAQALAAAPHHLLGAAASLVSVRAQVADALLQSGGGGAGPARGVLIEPSSQESGITVLQHGLNQIVVRNDFRRRAVAFVDRIDPDPAQIATFEVSPTPGATSLIGTISDIAVAYLLELNQTAYAGVSSDPVPVPLFPEDAERTDYRVTVIGAGASAGAESDQPAQRVDQLRGLIARTLVVDFLTPLLANAILPLGAGAIDDYLTLMNGNAVVASFITTLGNTVPQAMDKAYAGQMREAVIEVTNALASDGTVRLAFLELCAKVIYATAGAAETQRFVDHGQAFLSVVGLGDQILTGIDAAAQLHDILSSSRAQTFDVAVIPSTVILEPGAAEIEQGEQVSFTANVPDATGEGAPTLEYHWSTTGVQGFLRDDVGHEGTAFVSSRSQVQYVSGGTTHGQDEVAVEVYAIQGQDRVFVGRSEASIVNVLERTYQVHIVPEHTSVEASGSVQLQAVVDPPHQGGSLFYLWTTSGSFGSLFPAAGTLTGFGQVTYHADPNVQGEDWIQVEVFDDANDPIGQATASVEVTLDEFETSAFFDVQTYPAPSGYSGCYTRSTIEWGHVEGAAYYRLEYLDGGVPRTTTGTHDEVLIQILGTVVRSGDHFKELATFHSSRPEDCPPAEAYYAARFTEARAWGVF